jgi:medium-chain acyl-[acyl-carrier-protein] hydrolase
MAVTTSWFLRLSQGARTPTSRLFCFPHAGGAASAYRLWPSGLPADLDVFGAQLPGRANRLGEPALSAIADIVLGLAPALRGLSELPFVFYGHSTGALIAVQLARALAMSGGPLPKHLIVSGRRPPHVADVAAPMHPLSDESLVAEVQRRYGGIPPEVLEDPEFLSLVLPSLRGDITANETFRDDSSPPLACPITVFGARGDEHTPLPHLEEWRRVTSRSFDLRMFEGGHFFLHDNRTPVLESVRLILNSSLNPSTQ